MKEINKIADLSGLAILTYKGSDSPLRVGELATERPFAAFEGVNPKTLKIATVSNEKFDGIAWRKRDTSKQQFHQSVSTLVKNVNQSTFDTKLTEKVVEFITGKKSKWTTKGSVLPELTQEERVICVLAEFALDKFHTLNGIELKCSFYQGGEIVWKSKH